jgi:hypothetical protein
MPVLPTAPLEENKTKFAVVPSVGAWAKFTPGNKIIVIARSKKFFI